MSLFVLTTSGSLAQESNATPSAGPELRIYEASGRQGLLTWGSSGPEMELSVYAGKWGKKADENAPWILLEDRKELPASAEAGAKLTKVLYPEAPEGQTFTISLTQSSVPSPSPPTALLTGLLVECTYTGLLIPQNLILLGDVDHDGKYTEAGGAIFAIGDKSVPAGACIVVPATSAAELMEYARQKDWKALCHSQVIYAKTFADVKKLIPKLADPSTEALMKKFTQLQTSTLASNGETLKTPGAKQFLDEMASSFPEHVTARVFQAAAIGKIPVKMTEMAAGVALQKYFVRLREGLQKLPDPVSERRRVIKEFTDELTNLLSVSPPKFKPSPDSLKALLKSAGEWAKFNDQDKTDKAKAAREAFAKSLEQSALDFSPNPANK